MVFLSGRIELLPSYLHECCEDPICLNTFESQLDLLRVLIPLSTPVAELRCSPMVPDYLSFSNLRIPNGFYRACDHHSGSFQVADESA